MGYGILKIHPFFEAWIQLMMKKISQKVSNGIFLLSVSSMVLAQSSGGDFEITKYTIDGGGGQSSGDGFSVTGTIGQADASVEPMSGGGFTVAGGFWPDDSELPDLIFSNGFELIPEPDLPEP